VNENIRFALLSLLVIILLGILGYSLIEKWSLLNSLYMTIITISTVGFGVKLRWLGLDESSFNMVGIGGHSGKSWLPISRFRQYEQ